MLPDHLKDYPIAAALYNSHPDAIADGKYDHGEYMLVIAPEQILAVCSFLKDQQGFVRLSTVTGVDWYPGEPRYEVVYHLHAVERNERLRLKCRLRGENPAIESVTPVWASANWYERETFDLFGIQFNNHPDLRRIMMPDDYQGHPLRKDFPVTGPRV
jgi:NADH-quinone oxidoreductase subunit C